MGAKDVDVEAAQAEEPGPVTFLARARRRRVRQKVVPAGPLVVGQEPLDLVPQPGVIAAQLVQQGGSAGRVGVAEVTGEEPAPGQGPGQRCDPQGQEQGTVDS